MAIPQGVAPIGVEAQMGQYHIEGGFEPTVAPKVFRVPQSARHVLSTPYVPGCCGQEAEKAWPSSAGRDDRIVGLIAIICKMAVDYTLHLLQADIGRNRHRH